MTDQRYKEQAQLLANYLPSGKFWDAKNIEEKSTIKIINRGGIYSDTEGYERVYNLAHSTFDKSKFEIVGSPTITDDGIASGFSSEDCLTTNEIDFSTCQRWEYIIEFETSNFSNLQFLGGLGNSTNFAMATNINTDFTLSLYLSTGGSSWDISGGSGIKSTLTILQNTKYYMKRSFNGTSYKLDISEDGKSWINYINFNSTTRINPTILKPCIGNFKGLFRPIIGSIDLKQFSITVDGIQVFNGNKSGLDIIKPDNYEIVGSPTITNDGIASGFSSSDYIRSEIVSINNNTQYIIVSPLWKITEDVGEQVFIPMSWGNNATGAFNFSLRSNKTLGMNYNNTNGIGLGTNRANIIETDTYYQCRWEYNNGEIILSYRKADEDWIELTRGNVSVCNSSGVFFIGNNTPIINFDLNTFKVYVDGNLIYQPCLKIPYTLSNTGIKIVDVAYRNRILDLYEQTNNADYYTLDTVNKNYSLPYKNEEVKEIQQEASNLRKLLNAFGKEFVNIEDSLNWLRRELNIKTTYDLIEFWEKAYGIPDNDGIFVVQGKSIEERRFNLLLKETMDGADRYQDWEYIAKQFGYNVKVRPCTETEVQAEVPRYTIVVEFLDFKPPQVFTMYFPIYFSSVDISLVKKVFKIIKPADCDIIYI